MTDVRQIVYTEAGVNIDAANDAKSRIKRLARGTFNKQVLGDIGSFGAMFRLESAVTDPVLVASTDGVGTKLKIACQTASHEGIGYDLVAHCVNDILVQGARPLFFMDYIAMGKLEPNVVEALVAGLTQACKEANCPLIGGETAEMPGVYADGEYDIAGFIVGLVSRSKVIDGSRICEGDLLLGLASTGLHTNGYSLARKVFFEVAGYNVNDYVPELSGTLAEVLLRPHRSYLSLLDALLDTGLIKGLVHITGGGFWENIPRVLPARLAVRIERGSWPILPVFEMIRRLGNVPEAEMYRVFNMGIGMVVIISPWDEQLVREHFDKLGEVCYKIGVVTRNDGQAVRIE